MKLPAALAVAATLFAETGIRPRAAAGDYAAHGSGGGATIAATILSASEAKKAFAVDPGKLGYTVVEIGVYPDRNVEIAWRDFVLNTGKDGRLVRPAAPAAIGDKPVTKAPKIPERVQVHGGGEVGYESGRYGRGVYTGGGVGVGIGDRPTAAPAPKAPGQDTADYESGALPEGRFGKPLAGYLYFPVKLKPKSSVVITWYGADGQVRLPMPPTK
jgi:hypothetical protein